MLNWKNTAMFSTNLFIIQPKYVGQKCLIETLFFFGSSFIYSQYKPMSLSFQNISCYYFGIVETFDFDLCFPDLPDSRMRCKHLPYKGSDIDMHTRITWHSILLSSSSVPLFPHPFYVSTLVALQSTLYPCD